MTGTTFDESHPRLKGFSDYHVREIAGPLSGYEAARREALGGIKVKGVIAALAGLVACGVAVAGSPLFIAPGFVAVALFAWAHNDYVKAKTRLKTFLAERVCAFLDLSYDIAAQDYPLWWFESLRLVPHYHRSNIEDGIAGTYKGVRIHVADAKLTTRSTRRSWPRTLFQGLLCGFSVPIQFEGTTVIAGDRGIVGNWLSSIGHSGTAVRFDDQDFEAAFEVFASDEAEARRLLTPNFRARLVALARAFGSENVRLAFGREYLLVTINLWRDSFEAGSPFTPAGDPKQISRLLAELTFVFQVVDTLGLSQEIEG